MARRLHNIIRYDHHYFHGWSVSIRRRGVRYVRYFNDNPTRRAALAKAITWRDKTLARLPPDRKIKLRYSLNTTGEIGVTRGVNRTRAGRLVPYYSASWTDEHGRYHKRSFSVLKYGAREARARAVEIRRKAVAEMLRPRRSR